MYKNLLPKAIVVYAKNIPNEYHIICFIHKFSYSIDNRSFVEYMDTTLIIKNNIIGIKILDSTLNLDMFLILSHPNY